MIPFLLLLITYCLAESESKCNPETCYPPDCLCASQSPPNGLDHKKIPQFVMLTFDAAVTTSNFPFYQELLLRSGRKNKNGCAVAATFFVSHQYTDYRLVHRLYRRGQEVAIHSISHTPDVEMWKNLTYLQWRDEIYGMKIILSRFGKLPMGEIVGVRAPYLQTGGDTFFKMLLDEKFLYDCSTPTLQKTNPPLWPYTLDEGFQHDCQIQPCPKLKYKGLWSVPLVNWFGLPQLDKATGQLFEQPCAMIDGCTPQPLTVEETLTYLRKNFERHYKSTSKAPFPIFLREGWLQNKNRKQAFLQFIDELLTYDDVYFVTIKDVIDYLRNPVELDEYKQKCQMHPNLCPSPGYDCEFENKEKPDEGLQRMGSCIRCPSHYPWVGNPTG